jgi:hypothetical protein
MDEAMQDRGNCCNGCFIPSFDSEELYGFGSKGGPRSPDHLVVQKTQTSRSAGVTSLSIMGFLWPRAGVPVSISDS